MSLIVDYLRRKQKLVDDNQATSINDTKKLIYDARVKISDDEWKIIRREIKNKIKNLDNELKKKLLSSIVDDATTLAKLLSVSYQTLFDVHYNLSYNLRSEVNELLTAYRKIGVDKINFLLDALATVSSYSWAVDAQLAQLCIPFKAEILELASNVFISSGAVVKSSIDDFDLGVENFSVAGDDVVDAVAADSSATAEGIIDVEEKSGE